MRSALRGRLPGPGTLAAGFAGLLVALLVTGLLIAELQAEQREIRDAMASQSAAWALRATSAEVNGRERGLLLSGHPRFVRDTVVARQLLADARVRLLAVESAAPSREPIARLAAEAAWRLDFRAGENDGDLLATAAFFDRVSAGVAQIEQAEQARILDSQRRARRLAAGIVLALPLGGGALLFTALQVTRRIRADRDRLNRALAEVRELADSLEARVAARTADLAEANEELQRFAYIVSHDLRAPLVNVMGFTSELRHAQQQAEAVVERAKVEAPRLIDEPTRAALTTEMTEALDFIQASIERMERLIAAILAVSREGRRRITVEPFELGAMVRQIGDSLKAQFEAAGARLEIGELPPIETDRLALELVLGNLVDNAVKYLRPGVPGVVRVGGERTGDRVRLHVEDNGRGISPQDRQRVFELFRRAGAQDQPGHGVGLAQVRALVKRLGGGISLDSTVGVGSRFVVDLPARAPVTAAVD